VCALITTLMSDESALMIGTMSPLKLLQPFGSAPVFC